MLYLGIDPGASGGLAIIEEGKGIFAVEKMPPTERDVWEWIRGYTRGVDGVFALIEKVGGFVKGNPSPGSAMFKFGASYGGLRMALIAAGVPFDEVTPQKWQKGVGVIRKDGQGKGEFKNRLRAKAQQLFPRQKITLATADAILIAVHCKRIMG